MQEKVKQSENQEITSDATEETIEAVHAEVEEAQANGAAQTETEDVQSTSEPAAELTELEAKFQESENRYLRLLADFDNFRRRTQLEREAGEKYRAQSLITNRLPPSTILKERCKSSLITSRQKRSLKVLKWYMAVLLKH